MNKRVITTSLALVLALTVVLAVGKTDTSIELELAQYSESIRSRPTITQDVDTDILRKELSTPVEHMSVLTIPSEVNESELILDQQAITEGSLTVKPMSPLLESLAHMQQALDRLEQLAERTGLAVDALDKQLVVR